MKVHKPSYLAKCEGVLGDLLYIIFIRSTQLCLCDRTHYALDGPGIESQWRHISAPI